MGVWASGNGIYERVWVCELGKTAFVKKYRCFGQQKWYLEKMQVYELVEMVFVRRCGFMIWKRWYL